eukprot:1667259-Rhodomonas_salina.1
MLTALVSSSVHPSALDVGEFTAYSSRGVMPCSQAQQPHTAANRHFPFKTLRTRPVRSGTASESPYVLSLAAVVVIEGEAVRLVSIGFQPDTVVFPITSISTRDMMNLAEVSVHASRQVIPQEECKFNFANWG